MLKFKVISSGAKWRAHILQIQGNFIRCKRGLEHRFPTSQSILSYNWTTNVDVDYYFQTDIFWKFQTYNFWQILSLTTGFDPWIPTIQSRLTYHCATAADDECECRYNVGFNFLVYQPHPRGHDHFTSRSDLSLNYHFCLKKWAIFSLGDFFNIHFFTPFFKSEVKCGGWGW